MTLYLDEWVVPEVSDDWSMSAACWLALPLVIWLLLSTELVNNKKKSNQYVMV